MPINLGTIQKENEEKEKQAKALEEAKKKTSYINVGGLKLAKTRYEYKADYEKQKLNKKSAKEDLQNYYSSNGITTSNGGVFPTATPLSYQNDLKQFEKDKYTSVPLNPVQDLIERQKASQENYEKYLAFQKENESTIQEKKQEVVNQYNKTAEKYNDYQQRKLDSDNIGWYDKTIGSALGGASSLFSQFGGELAINENGGVYYTPSYNELKQQKVLDSYSDNFLGTLGKIGSSALYETGKIATTAALNSLAGGLGSTAYFTDLYTKQYNQTLSEGYSSSQALTYATLGTLAEAVTGKFLGGTTKAIFGGSSSEMNELISSGLSKLIKNHPHIVNGIASAISEGSEEFIQEYLDVFNRNLALDENNQVTSETFENALYSAAVGALTGGATGAFDGNIYQKLRKKNTNVNANVNTNTNVNVNENVETNEKKPSKVELPITNTQTKVETNNEISLPINYQSNTDIKTNLENNINLPLNENVIEETNNNANTNVIQNQVNEELNNQQMIAWRNENNLVNEVSNKSNYNIENNVNNTNTEVVNNIVNKDALELDNSSFSLKNQQLEIIKNNNPVADDYHTWIRNINNIKTYEETLNDIDYKEYFDAGEDFDKSYTVEMAKKALETGKITVYSSYPIEQGTFVTPSKMEAKSYAGNGKIYSQEVNLTDVAWIDPTQGQYARVNSKTPFVDVSQIKLTKDNASIKQDLLNGLNSNLNFYSDKEYSNIKSNKIEIAKSDNDIMEFVDEAIKSNNSNKTIYFGKINDILAQEIYNSTGIDVKGYNLSLKANNIRKILKDHGNAKTEKLRGQIAITKNDFKYIDDIVLENDAFFLSGTTSAGKPSITFSKVINEKYMLVEYVSDKHHTLEVQTMWKNKKKNSVTGLHDNNPGLNTPKTGSDTSSFSINNIPQNGTNVKSGGSTKYSMQESINNTQELDNNSFSIEEKIDEAINNIEQRNSRDNELNEKFEDIKAEINETIAKYKEKEINSAKESLEYEDITEDVYANEIKSLDNIDTLDDMIDYLNDHFGLIEQDHELNQLKERYEEISDKITQNNANTFKEKVEKGTKNIVNYILESYPELDIKVENSNKNNSFYVKFYSGDNIVGELRVSDHVRPPKRTSSGWEQHVYDAQYVPNVNAQDNIGRPVFYNETNAKNELIETIKDNLEEISEDTKYSLPTKEWVDHLKENYPSAGTKTKMSDIKLPTKKDITKTSKNEVSIPLKEDIKLSPSKEIYKSEIERKVKDRLRNKSYKMVKETSKKANDYINFDRQEKQQFRSDLEKYRSMTKEELQTGKVYEELKEIVGRYANREVTYVNQELKDTKADIRNRKIKVSENLKQQFDYNTFRKENFGKLNLSNDGTNVDSIWSELVETYPQYFSNDVVNEIDMLENLSSFMNQPTNLLENYELTESEIRDTVNRVYDTMLNNSFSEEELKKIQTSLEDKYSARTRLMVQQELLDEIGIELSDIANGKDISHLEYLRTDPIRLNEKVFGHKIGKKINDATINKTKDNEASRIRFLNKERSEISDLGIKARSKESAAVQKYAEKSYVNDSGQKYYYGDKELAIDFPDVKTQEKIKDAVKVIRGKYDTYIDNINQVITSLGYDEIPKRKDYMRHFQELSTKFSEWGLPLSDISSENLPTDINGITDQFRPGKNWFASAMERKGIKTTYDAITGIDGYLEGASNLIYHTKDIQRYRTLSKLIRDTYGQTHGLDDMKDFTAKEFNQRLSDIQSNKLSGYVAWLDEQANSLAGKKGLIDRAGERIFGRKMYGVLNWAKKQVGSNMTGFNVRSSLTNFASTIQGASKTNKIALIKGILSTNKNLIHKDSMIDKSTFLTSRFGSDTLSKTIWQKMSNAGQILMSGTDYYTSNVIWRSKYFENIQKGMNETQAIKNADDFSARIMGDRSKGSTAEIFNSKTMGVITQFQLEVNNQWSSLIHDNKIDVKSGNATVPAITFQLGQLFAMSYLFNGLFKALTGSDVMIDPIQMLLDLFDDADEDKDLEERMEDVLADLVDDLPFASLFTSGGRLPISEAFTGAGTFIKKATNQTDKYGNDITWEDVGKDAISSAFYWLLPTGYGQLKKTYKGAKMYDKSLPIAGSYTDGGNLRFEADTSIGGKTKALLFGQYSSKEAQKYIDSGYKTIDEKDLDKLKDLDMSTSEYREYRTELNSIKSDEDLTNEDKKTNIANKIIKSDLSDKEKAFLYSKYYSNEETIEEMLDLKIPISEFIKLDSQNFQGEYDEETGKTISGSKKNEVINYVNSLNLSVAQKAILIKSKYSSYDKYDSQIVSYVNKLNKKVIDKQMLLKNIGFDDYDRDIVNYINSQHISKEEKEEKLKELGFTIRDGRVYYK